MWLRVIGSCNVAPSTSFLPSPASRSALPRFIRIHLQEPYISFTIVTLPDQRSLLLDDLRPMVLCVNGESTAT